MSWLDKLLDAVPGAETTRRLAIPTMIGYGFALARLLGSREADVEHMLHGILSIVDVKNALGVHGVFADDASAVIAQLIEEKATFPDDEQPPYPLPFTPRVRAIFELIDPRNTGNVYEVSSVALLRATAAALPAELSFLRKALEAAAIDVGPLLDGSLAMLKDGGLSLKAWDGPSGSAIAQSYELAKKHPGGIVNPHLVLFSLLLQKRLRESLSDRGVDPTALVRDLEGSIPPNRWKTRDLTEGPAVLSPTVVAIMLRTERYAAEDATNVRLRHLLAALHDEPTMAPWIEKIAG